MDHNDLVSQFLAKGGTVTKVAEGERATTDKAIYSAMREGVKAASVSDEQDQRAYAKWEREFEDRFLARGH